MSIIHSGSLLLLLFHQCVQIKEDRSKRVGQGHEDYYRMVKKLSVTRGGMRAHVYFDKENNLRDRKNSYSQGKGKS